MRIIFIDVAERASKTDVKEWLSGIGLNVFLEVYDKNERPKFENTEVNIEVL